MRDFNRERLSYERIKKGAEKLEKEINDFIKTNNNIHSIICSYLEQPYIEHYRKCCSDDTEKYIGFLKEMLDYYKSILPDNWDEYVEEQLKSEGVIFE